MQDGRRGPSSTRRGQSRRGKSRNTALHIHFCPRPSSQAGPASHRKPRRSLGVLGQKREMTPGGRGSKGSTFGPKPPAVAMIPRARARLRGSRKPEERPPQPFGVNSRNAGGLPPCSPIAESGFGGLSSQLSFSHLGKGGLNVL